MKNQFVFDGKTINEWLALLARDGNARFAQSLHPGIEGVLGIRMPKLRKLAKSIARQDAVGFLEVEHDFSWMESRTLYGLVLSEMTPDESVDTYLKRVAKFVPLIHAWSVCDVFHFAGGKRYFTLHQEAFEAFVWHYLQAEEPYALRFGVVMTLYYFIDETHLERLFEAYSCLDASHHYVSMAVAWAVSVCYTQFREETYRFLSQHTLDRQTHNRAVQKIIESLRIEPAEKEHVKTLKRK